MKKISFVVKRSAASLRRWEQVRVSPAEPPAEASHNATRRPRGGFRKRLK